MCRFPLSFAAGESCSDGDGMGLAELQDCMFWVQCYSEGWRVGLDFVGDDFFVGWCKGHGMLLERCCGLGLLSLRDGLVFGGSDVWLVIVCVCNARPACLVGDRVHPQRMRC